mmetsp:Transcript_61563/g.74040  ORF Transcript_61563/g.74040 Transcript_61563/m.74040 type:complete len:298 (+) Transcript_61563:80-973(+)
MTLLSETHQSLNGNLNEYEKTRARNIEKHNARLRMLGLITSSEEDESNNSAWGRGRQNIIGSGISRKRKATRKNEEDNNCRRKQNSLPTRRSVRLLGLDCDNIDKLDDDEDGIDNRKEKLQQKRLRIVGECRAARLRIAQEVGSDFSKAASENPTATYEHCLMRVKTMTNKGLANRIKAIERCAGKHCVVKMAIFKSCLQDENEWDLANLACESLERLKENTIIAEDAASSTSAEISPIAKRVTSSNSVEDSVIAENVAFPGFMDDKIIAENVASSNLVVDAFITDHVESSNSVVTQ